MSDEDLLRELERDLRGNAPAGQPAGTPSGPTSITRWYLLKRNANRKCLVVNSLNIGDPPIVPQGWTVKWDSEDEGVVRQKHSAFCGSSNLC